MKQRYNHDQRNQALHWLLIAGALAGACQKQGSHSATPESAPVATTASPLVTNTTNQGSATAPLSTEAPALESSAQNSEATAGPSLNSSGWPGALLAANPEGQGLNQLGISTIKGCLSKPTAEQDSPTRSARTAKPQTFRVTAMGNGALVTHDFSHACCLSATTETKLEGSTITVHERLTGTPCRCVCESSIQTRVHAPVGEYDVKLVVETNGVQSHVGTQPLSIKKLNAR